MKKAKFAIVRRVLHTEWGNSNHLPKEKTKQNRRQKNRIKNKRKSQSNYSNPYKTETSYKTGYAGTESKFERAKIKHKARKAARKAKATRTSNINPKGFFGELGDIS